jgi:hypothetical protein
MSQENKSARQDEVEIARILQFRVKYINPGLIHVMCLETNVVRRGQLINVHAPKRTK